MALIATDALGPEHVHGVLMPSRYSSDHSITDAEKLCAELGIESRVIGIEPAHAALLEMLAASFAGLEPGLAEENIQPRIRGVLLMALSNKFPGWLVLTTGNKSEMAVGYSTLYGDTAGGFAVIKDVPKTLVYELARDRNARAGRPLIPESVLTKPPSAELRPGQRDDQSIPPYDVLDPDPRGVRGARPHPRRPRGDGLRSGPGGTRHQAGRPVGVQASPDPARCAHHHQGIRKGPAAAHHQPLSRLTGVGPPATAY